MKHITIGCGIGEDKHSIFLAKEFIDSGIAYVQNYAADKFGGIALWHTVGSWKHEGRVIIEAGLTFSLYADADDADIVELAKVVRDVFNQMSVVLAVTEGVTLRFI